MTVKSKKLTYEEIAKMFEEFINRAACEFFEIDKIKKRAPDFFDKNQILCDYTLCKTVSAMVDSEYMTIGCGRIRKLKIESAKNYDMSSYDNLPSNIQLM